MLNQSLINKQCPGLYCGKLSADSPCGPCPRGYYPDRFSFCVKCIQPFSLYDWLFLIFMSLQPILYSLFVTLKLSLAFKTTNKIWLLRLLIFIKSAISLFLTLLFFFDPIGRFQIYRCPTKRLSDWYTILYNPRPNFTNPLKCTHEAVYPLSSIVLVHGCLSTIITVILEPLFFIYIIRDKAWLRYVYLNLYMYPLLSLAYIIFGGVIYHSYGYIVFIAAIITSAGIFSTVLLRNMAEITISSVIKVTFLNPQHFLFVGCTWLALFYGIISINELKQPTYYGLVFAVIPLPYILFCLTLHFTNPNIEVYSVI